MTQRFQPITVPDSARDICMGYPRSNPVSIACKEIVLGNLSKPAKLHKLFVWKYFGHPMTEIPGSGREYLSSQLRLCFGEFLVLFTCLSGIDSKLHSHPIAQQQTLKETLHAKQNMPLNSPRSTAITNQIGKFIVKDLKPYTVVEKPCLKSSYMFWR